jgi:hypothetical protein
MVAGLLSRQGLIVIFVDIFCRIGTILGNVLDLKLDTSVGLYHYSYLVRSAVMRL